MEASLIISPGGMGKVILPLGRMPGGRDAAGVGQSEGQTVLCIPNSLAIGIDLHVFKIELSTCHMLINLQIGRGPGAPGCQPDLW